MRRGEEARPRIVKEGEELPEPAVTFFQKNVQGVIVALIIAGILGLINTVVTVQRLEAGQTELKQELNMKLERIEGKLEKLNDKIDARDKATNDRMRSYLGGKR